MTSVKTIEIVAPPEAGELDLESMIGVESLGRPFEFDLD